jgi:Na+-driven multidrug efflux pump
MFIMICMGLNQGMQPIAGYNYGARQYSRVKQVFWMTAKWATVVTMICFLISMFIPKIATGIFTHDEQLLAIASNGLTILGIGLPTVGFQMITTNFFQSLGMIRRSVILSLSRQILFLLPALYLLPLWIGATGIWLSYPVSDILSFLLSAIMLRNLFKKFSTLKDGGDSSILGGNI